jgi:hypothetical protein
VSPVTGLLVSRDFNAKLMDFRKVQTIAVCFQPQLRIGTGEVYLLEGRRVVLIGLILVDGVMNYNRVKVHPCHGLH